MSYPNIPDINPVIGVEIDDSIALLLAAIAMEELGLAHIINAEAEKIQYVLGTIEGQTPPEIPPTLDEIIAINRSVDRTLRSVIEKELLLQFNLEEVSSLALTYLTTSTTTTSSTTTAEPTLLGSAWSVGTDFGTGNAQYTTLGSNETEKTVTLGLGATYEDVGEVRLQRIGNSLSVTIATDALHEMDQVHLYVDDTAPVNSAPGSFPYQYTVVEPADYFSTHTFLVDVSAFAGSMLYIAAHARIYLK